MIKLHSETASKILSQLAQLINEGDLEGRMNKTLRFVQKGWCRGLNRAREVVARRY